MTGLSAPTADDAVNILLVDDQPGKLLVYESMLSELGETLLCVLSAEALELLLSTDVAVVLVDVCMPDMDGFELATMIRQHPRFRNTAIILVSAVLSNEVDRLRGYHSGAMDYVPVPVVPEILRAKVAVFADLYRKTRQLELLNESLEAQVAKRTSDLEEALAKYRDSEEKLREADRRKDDFLAVLSHELRNPLAGIVGGIEVLDHIEMDSADAIEMRQVIARQAKLMQRLLDDLLDVTRIARGKIVLNEQSLDLRGLVESVGHDLKREFSEIGQSLVLELPEAQIICRGDAARLTQVIVNVLQNARKFSDSGAVTRLTLVADRAQQAARISIVDQGIGMDPTTLTLAFEPFVQAEQSLARSRGGLGLGLALTKRLVEKHGGEITINSPGLGSGTSITIRLPISTVTELEVDPDRLPSFGAMRFRVLIIDDRRDAVHPLVKLLQLSGHEVKVALDGETGLEIAATFHPDVVLCDIGLPDVDGYEVARRFRANTALFPSYLVAITGYGQEADRCRALEAGFHMHLAKPVGAAEIHRLLEALASRQTVSAKGAG